MEQVDRTITAKTIVFSFRIPAILETQLQSLALLEHNSTASVARRLLATAVRIERRRSGDVSA